ncbi:MAG: hypothetical protein WKG01_31435 [Kofleriaceae bacterium]
MTATAPQASDPAALDLALDEIVRARIAEALRSGARWSAEAACMSIVRCHSCVSIGLRSSTRIPAPRIWCAQASYLIAPADATHEAAVAELATAVVESLATSCGACLVLELWAGDDAGPAASASVPRRGSPRDDDRRLRPGAPGAVVDGVLGRGDRGR